MRNSRKSTIGRDSTRDNGQLAGQQNPLPFQFQFRRPLFYDDLFLPHIGMVRSGAIVIYARRRFEPFYHPIRPKQRLAFSKNTVDLSRISSAPTKVLPFDQSSPDKDFKYSTSY
jgi:hypothetical protein